MSKDDWSKFYWGAWQSDPNLKRCSKAAKGVWMDVLALMFECEDRGVLATGGVPWADDELCAAIGGDIAENLSCLRELCSKNVARRRSSDGALFSKRMVTEHQLRMERARSGSIGGSKTQAKGQAKRKQSIKQTVSISVSDSDSTSDSVSSSGDSERACALPIVTPDMVYAAYPRHEAKAHAHQAIVKAAGIVAARSDPPPDAMAWLLERTQAYAKATAQWPKGDRQFIPLPATWFNKGRYDDDDEQWKRNGQDHSATRVAKPQAVRPAADRGEFAESLTL